MRRHPIREYARDIVQHLDLERAGKLDPSLGSAISALKSGLKGSR